MCDFDINDLQNIVSFSGGRSSAVLVDLAVKMMVEHGIHFKFIFMDTSAEHQKTYDFINKIVDHYKIDLVCLRVEINPELGRGNSYRVISLDECKPDYAVFTAMLEKYGTPYIGGQFCTDRLKTTPYKKYCDEHFGKNNYRTWIGIRADEPKRLRTKPNTKYLADICNYTKQDVLNFWHKMPFDLEIPEHLGNCVLCIQKSACKIALACRDEPYHRERMLNLIYSENTRVIDNRRGISDIMYRGNHSLGSIIEQYSELSRDEIARRLKNNFKNSTATLDTHTTQTQS